MVYNYKDLLSKNICKNDLDLKKQLNDKKIYKIELGLYSDKKVNSKLEIIAKKYKNYIFNSDSAFFYHGLTDNIPQKYFLAGKRGAQKIDNEDIIQTFMDDKYFLIGDSYIIFNNVKIRVYDKERMLIELVRNKNKIPFDMYKEIINNYRNIINDLNLLKLQNYLSNFNNKDKLLKIIQEEVL